MSPAVSVGPCRRLSPLPSPSNWHRQHSINSISMNNSRTPQGHVYNIHVKATKCTFDRQAFIKAVFIMATELLWCTSRMSQHQNSIHDRCISRLESNSTTASIVHQTRLLEDRVAIITGGASGIGAATTRLFVENGAYVIVADIQNELGEILCKEIGSRAQFMHCDVTKEDDIEAAVNFAISRWGHLDIMFNNAGIADENNSFLSMDMAKYDLLMDVHVRGMVMGIKHASKIMAKAKKGVIINSCSVTCLIPGKSMPAYNISKHAVLGITKAAAAEFAEHGIRVNCISPYGVVTPLTVKWFQRMLPGSKAQDLELIIASQAALQGHQLNVNDIAQAVLFLCSDNSAYISGHNLVIDGAYSTGAGLKPATH